MTAKFLWLGALAVVVSGIFFFVSSFLISPLAQTGRFSELAQVPIASFTQDGDVQPETIPLQASVVDSIVSESVADIAAEKNEQALETAEPPAVKTGEPAALPAPEIKKCTYQTNQFPDYRGLIFNEIAWMGTPASANDEWIELKNISGNSINVLNWQVLDKGEQIKIILPSLVVPAGGFVLLERGEEAVPFRTATVVYTGALSNTNEGLRLFDKDCIPHDGIIADPEWPAGSSEEKRTMERGNDFSWHTYFGSSERGVFGTPMETNSIPPVVVQAETPTTTPPVQDVVPKPTSTPVTPPIVETPTSGLSHIVISEVQITGGSGLTTNDYIEIYNPLSTEFNLKGYRLVKRTKTGATDTSIKSWTTDTFVPAGGYYVWANSGYTTISKTVGAATSESIAGDNGIAIRQGPADTGVIIDSVAWGAAANSFIEGSVFATNPGANEKLRRKQWQDTDNNAADFEIGS